MTMKKILSSVTAVAAVSSIGSANATSQAFCTGNTAAYSSATAPTVGSFLKTTFTVKCSANVHLVGDDMLTYYGAGSASLKGKNIFQGSTAGGGVSSSGSCAASGCTSANAQTAATSAPSS